MDPETQADADADAAALERDVQLLEAEAAKAGKALTEDRSPDRRVARARARRLDLGAPLPEPKGSEPASPTDLD